MPVPLKNMNIASIIAVIDSWRFPSSGSLSRLTTIWFSKPEERLLDWPIESSATIAYLIIHHKRNRIRQSQHVICSLLARSKYQGHQLAYSRLANFIWRRSWIFARHFDADQDPCLPTNPWSQRSHGEPGFQIHPGNSAKCCLHRFICRILLLACWRRNFQF